MSLFRDIQRALDIHLSLIAAPISVAWENSAFKPLPGTPWIRPTVLNSRSDTLDFDNASDNPGIYQVDLFYPINKGTADLLEKLDDIVEHFASDKDLQVGDSRILIRSISKLPSRIDDIWFSASLEILFNCYKG